MGFAVIASRQPAVQADLLQMREADSMLTTTRAT
jgi:hypothetical protein